MNNLSSLSPSQLRKAAAIKEEIEALEKELSSLLGGASSPVSKITKPVAKAKAPKKKGGMSPAVRAKIAAAAKARWAKAKASGKNSL